MRKLRLFEKIFSIVNKPSYKQITLFGIPVYKKFFATEEEKTFYAKLPVVKNKIVFMNYWGKSYGCNPKYILEEIRHRKLPYELVWAINGYPDDFEADFPQGIRFVQYKSKEFIKELASAKIWISNHHFAKQFALGLIKKPEQFFIQTWHGSLGIKKIEKNVKTLTDEQDWEHFACESSKATDIWVSNSKFESQIYEQAFWDVKGIKELGHPRNDIFFKSAEEKNNIRKKVLQALSIPEDKKVLLYAPTFKDTTSLSSYNIEFSKLLPVLKEKFGGDWVVVSRMHPSFRKRHYNKIKELKNTYNANNYPDIQELLVSADIAITDYSSCIFDFMLSKKPAFIYAANISDYEIERGFYYPLSSTPFPIAENNNQLIENITHFDYKEYKEKIEIFLKEKDCMEDGHASERVVDIIEKIMSGNYERN